MSAVIKRYGGKPHLKLTLLILADRASDDGYCWPSYDEIAGKLGCSRRSAINNVNALIAADLLQIVAKGGRFTDPQTKKHRGFSNRFVINVAAIEALPLLYQPRRSSPQGVVDGCSALQDMGEVGFTHASAARVKPTSPGTSDKTSSSTVTGEVPVENLIRYLADAWKVPDH
jgi:hypothetical protein